MKRILLLSILLISSAAHADVFTLNNKNYQNGHPVQYLDENILGNLAFAEKQLFDKVYKKQSITERLDRLEIAVWGAIQAGSEAMRAQNLARALTNVASGGNGLQYFAKKGLGLNHNSNFGSSWSFGGGSFGNSLGFNNHRHGYRNFNFGKNHFHSPRYANSRYHFPKCNCRSHKMPASYYNPDPITNGDFLQNYSLGTSVKILDD